MVFNSYKCFHSIKASVSRVPKKKRKKLFENVAVKFNS